LNSLPSMWRIARIKGLSKRSFWLCPSFTPANDKHNEEEQEAKNDSEFELVTIHVAHCPDQGLEQAVFLAMPFFYPSK
jgi:hypothetical protein